MSDVNQWYRVLGLAPGSSLEAVNQAYKDLVLTWHPDRVSQDDAHLQEQAHEKLKQLNHARDQLRQWLSQYPSQSIPSAGYQAPSAPPTQPPRQSSDPWPWEQQRSHPSTPPRPSKPHPDPPRQTRSSSYRAGPHLSTFEAANLVGADLKEAYLEGQNMKKANLERANLSDAFLHKTDLSEANLFKANLFRANLLQANLRGANLQQANLIGADLSGADLSGANLTGARVGFTNKVMVKMVGTILDQTIMPNGKPYQPRPS